MPFGFYLCIFGYELPIGFGILGLSGFLPSRQLFFTSEVLSICRVKHCPLKTFNPISAIIVLEIRPGIKQGVWGHRALINVPMAISILAMKPLLFWEE